MAEEAKGLRYSPWAEGSFHCAPSAKRSDYNVGGPSAPRNLVTKDANRIVHGFGITQKLDRVVLEGIRHILHISTKVVYKEKYNHHMIDTTNSRAIDNVSKYFFNTMKGMKGVEYRIWSRSFNNHKGDYSQLVKIQKLLRVPPWRSLATRDVGPHGGPLD